MIKVLIVDDKTENIYLLQSMLDSKDFKTFPAKNGAEALGLLKTFIPDLIIADILMPVMDGFTLCRECKKDEVLKNIPFFFYTATYIDAKDEEYALSLGADRFILKPQEPEIFIKIINDFLGEVRNKVFHPKNIIQQPELVVLKEYNEVLIRKIEDKMLQTEKSEKELKRYAEALEKEIDERKKKEALFHTLARVSPVGIFRTAPDGKITYVNPKWSELSGLSGKEASGSGWLNAVHSDDRGRLSESWINNLKSQNESSTEYRFVRPDGSIAWVLGKAVPEIVGMEVVGYIGTITDITERKLAEVDLQLSEKQLSTIYETVGDVIYYLAIEADGIYRFISVSQTFYKVTGLSPEMIIGKLVTEVIPEPSLSIVLEKYRQAIDEKTIIQWEETSEYPTGKLIGEVSITPVVDNNGLCTHLVGSVHDITKMKLTEEELIKAKDKAEESDRLKTAFLHNISHEVRTPMNAIVGFSDLIIDPDLTPEIRNEFVHTIVQASNQLLSIITQIVNMATIEAGQEKIFEKEIALNSIFKMVSDQFHSEAVRKNISLTFNTPLPENEDKIRTDETKLIQIISNLLGNALKFTKNGSIDFGYVVKDKYLEFYVKDTGIGIPEELHGKIFERFRQVETTLAREFEGSGLGLSISKAYVELLGGKIWLTSRPGEGSAFYFTIPFGKTTLDTRPNEITSEKEKKALKKPVTILITEDIDNNFNLIAQYLSNDNIAVIRAVNGKEAIEKCENDRQIQMVLMDLKMPVMDGFEATKRIKAILPDLPVIAQTAYARDTDKAKALACGCSDFLSKPFKKEELLTMIHEHLVFD